MLSEVVNYLLNFPMDWESSLTSLCGNVTLSSTRGSGFTFETCEHLTNVDVDLRALRIYRNEKIKKI